MEGKRKIKQKQNYELLSWVKSLCVLAMSGCLGCHEELFQLLLSCSVIHMHLYMPLERNLKFNSFSLVYKLLKVSKCV